MNLSEGVPEHHAMTGEFAKGLESLGEIFDFLGRFAARNGLGPKAEFQVGVVAEELFTNTLKYGAKTHKPVRISLEKVGAELRLEMVDFDAEPFDADEVAPPALSAPIGERRAGGLGLHLVRSLVDELTYEYRDRELRVLVTKKLET